MSNDLEKCICGFAKLLGPTKATIVGLIDALVAQLYAIKVIIQLANVDLEDLARQQALELLLESVDLVLVPVEAPFSIVLGYTKPFSDCPPVNNFAKIVKQVKNYVFGAVYEAYYEAEQYLEAMESKDREIDYIDRMIDALQNIKDALEQCIE